jgi:hypothetical protein
MGIFDNDTEIQSLINAELSFINNSEYKNLIIPNIYQEQILEKKKIIIAGDANKAAAFLKDKQAELKSIQTMIENRFRDDYLNIKSKLGVKVARELSVKSAGYYKTLLMDSFNIIYPKVLDDIAEKTLINNAKKNNLL